MYLEYRLRGERLSLYLDFCPCNGNSHFLAGAFLFLGGNMDFLPTIADGIPELGIFEKDGKAWTTSRDLARCFNKRHSDVIRAIRKTGWHYLSADYIKCEIALSKYKDVSGKKNDKYIMTWKGFSMVAMGFTGKGAMEVKKRFVSAFDLIGKLIDTKFISKDGYKEMTSAIKHNIGNHWTNYSKEADMVNSILLGMTSKQFKELYGLKDSETPRDHAVQDKLNDLDRAQRLNAQLILGGLDYTQREEIIRRNYK
jgi:Rha family phage regulatory protein